jgi:type I pantothenate kinase
VVRDLVDYLIFLDMDQELAYQRYKKRYLTMIEHARENPKSWFAQFLDVPAEEIDKMGRYAWEEINQKNYYENILPLKNDADAIVCT